ncbi:hypothetical protein SAMN04488553_2813 [Gramella sp. MAR_2010_147]|nr:hypothetical protein SAMN04488553_2813 [Gramella sp. MAR_2010_147]
MLMAKKVFQQLLKNVYLKLYTGHLKIIFSQAEL